MQAFEDAVSLNLKPLFVGNTEWVRLITPNFTSGVNRPGDIPLVDTIDEALNLARQQLTQAS
jgi:hypothetical protein